MPPVLQDSLFDARPAWLPAAFAALGRHRFATAEQLAVAVGAPTSDITATLDALVAERLLQRLQPTREVDGAGPGPAYALRKPGATLLARLTGRPVLSAPHAQKSLLTLAHEITVTQVGVVLERLHAEQKLALRRFETTPEKIAAHAFLPSKAGLDRVALVADALAVVEHQGQLHGFLVECDRGTVSVARMQKKFAGYHALWRADGHLARWGVRAVRVLVIVPNATRRERLRAAALAGTGGSGLFWFAEERVLDLNERARMLGPVWYVSRAEDLGPEPLFTPPMGTLVVAPARVPG